MYNLNTATIEGNLTANPEMKALPSGQNVTTFSIATNRSALVQGRLQTRSWEKDGVKHYRTEIVANDVTFGAKPQTSTVADTGVEYPKPATEEEPPF